VARMWKRKKSPEGSLLGVPEPRPYRKSPHEAYTVQAYYYIFYWYRGARVAWIGAVWVMVASAIALVWWSCVVTEWAFGISVVLAIAVAYLSVAVAALEPLPAATYIRYDDEGVNP
jgi:hypothetical protein